MIQKPCVQCGVLSDQNRCSAHRRATAWRRGYDAEYSARRAVALAREPWCHSRPCPYRDAGTLANPLTADHVIPVSQGGRHGPLTVLCLRCNSARGNRPGAPEIFGE